PRGRRESRKNRAMNAAAHTTAEAETRPQPGRPVRAPELLSLKQALPFAAGAVAALDVAYAFPSLSFLVVVYLYCLFKLSALPTSRTAFYFGVAVGYLVYAPHLTFFWTIFGWPAVVLWGVLAFWLGLFVVLARLCRRRFGALAVLLVPFVWTGLEYFRSELYFLRFSWLNVGYAFCASPQIFCGTRLGLYGVGLALMFLTAPLSLLSRTGQSVALGFYLIVLGSVLNLPAKPEPARQSSSVQVVGLQMEFPFEAELVQALDR